MGSNKNGSDGLFKRILSTVHGNQSKKTKTREAVASKRLNSLFLFFFLSLDSTDAYKHIFLFTHECVHAFSCIN